MNIQVNQTAEPDSVVVVTSTFKSYVYEPCEDISTYELALIVPIFHGLNAFSDLEAYPHWDKIKRHFSQA